MLHACGCYSRYTGLLSCHFRGLGTRPHCVGSLLGSVVTGCGSDRIPLSWCLPSSPVDCFHPINFDNAQWHHLALTPTHLPSSSVQISGTWSQPTGIKFNIRIKIDLTKEEKKEIEPSQWRVERDKSIHCCF
jgi:hypothetical protein